MMPRQAVSAPAALLVSPCVDDRVVLGKMFQQQNWKLSAVETLGAAIEFLSQASVSLVITERDLPLAGWKDVLRKIRDRSDTPPLVVVSRLADEYLWSEVLNLGGYDVLAKPLSESEALRVFRHAFGLGKQVCSSRPKAAPAAWANASSAGFAG